jgi:hypothetical protein
VFNSENSLPVSQIMFYYDNWLQIVSTMKTGFLFADSRVSPHIRFEANIANPQANIFKRNSELKDWICLYSLRSESENLGCESNLI